jgi:WD40 repeat protein
MKRVFGLLALLSFLATLWLWWESKRPVPRATVLRQLNVWQICFFTEDGRLFVCGDAKEIRLYDILDGELVACWPRSIDRLESVTGRHNDMALGVYHKGGEVEVFDLIRGKTVSKFFPGEGTAPFVSLSPNGKFAATVHDRQTVRIWEVETGRLFRELEFGRRVSSISFSPDSAQLAVAGQGNAVNVIALPTGEVTDYVLLTGVGGMWCSFTTDGRLLGCAPLNAKHDGLWDLTNNRLIARWPRGGSGPLTGGLFVGVCHYPYRRLAELAYMYGAEDIGRALDSFSGQLQMIDTRTGRVVASFPLARLSTLAVFPDGKTLATFSYKDGCVRLWDLPPKRAVHPGFAWGGLGLTVVLAAWWWYLPRRAQSKRPGTETPAGPQRSDHKATA